MKTRLSVLLLLASASLLAACVNSPRQQQAVASYDLGLPVAALPNTVSEHAGIALEVRLPSWLDAQAMYYRLAYVDKQRLHRYAQARWVGQAGPLVQQRLKQQLGIAPGSAPCTLRVELDDFSQSFDSPASSRAEIRGEALLLGKGRAVLGRLPLQLEAPALSADAAGGASALAVATDKMGAAISLWLKQQPLAQCRNLK